MKNKKQSTCDGAVLVADNFETLFVVGRERNKETITCMLKMSQGDEPVDAVKKLFLAVANAAERLVADNQAGGHLIVSAIIGGLQAGLEVAEPADKD